MVLGDKSSLVKSDAELLSGFYENVRGGVMLLRANCTPGQQLIASEDALIENVVHYDF